VGRCGRHPSCAPVASYVDVYGRPAATTEARAGTSARSKAAGYAGVIDKPFLVLGFLATLKDAVGTP